MASLQDTSHNPFLVLYNKCVSLKKPRRSQQDKDSSLCGQAEQLCRDLQLFLEGSGWSVFFFF